MLSIPLLLLVTHFVGDFLLQSDWMALNKSKRWDALFVHVSVYTTCFLWVPHLDAFFFLTFASHFLTDAITSRLTARLWQANERHWFFVTIGFDQLIHATTLALTWQYLQ